MFFVRVIKMFQKNAIHFTWILTKMLSISGAVIPIFKQTGRLRPVNMWQVGGEWLGKTSVSNHKRHNHRADLKKNMGHFCAAWWLISVFSGLPPNVPEAAVVAFVAGYVLHILIEWQFCQECIERLQQEKSTSPYLIYIRMIGIYKHIDIPIPLDIPFDIPCMSCTQIWTFTCFLIDRGGLKYPSNEFTARMWTVYKFLKDVLPIIDSTTNILQDLVEFLGPRLCSCDTFLCEVVQRNLENEQKKS